MMFITGGLIILILLLCIGGWLVWKRESVKLFKAQMDLSNATSAIESLRLQSQQAEQILNDKISELNVIVAQRDTLITQLNAEIAFDKTTVAQLGNKIDNLNDKITKLNGDINTASANFMLIKNALTVKTQQLNDAQNTIEYMKLSTPMPSQWYGNASGIYVGTPFVSTCNGGPDDYVSEIDINHGGLVDAISVKCASDIQHDKFGGSGGASDAVKCKDGFGGVVIRSGNGVDNLNPICSGNVPSDPISLLLTNYGAGYGGTGGTSSMFVCPKGKKLRTVAGIAGNYVGKVGFACS